MTPEERILRLEKLVLFMTGRFEVGVQDKKVEEARELAVQLHADLNAECDLFVEPE